MLVRSLNKQTTSSCSTMLWLSQLILCAVCLVIVVANDHHGPPVVQTDHGKLRGKTVRSWTGKKIFSFVGVRFAEPPVGTNRFKVSHQKFDLLFTTILYIQ